MSFTYDLNPHVLPIPDNIVVKLPYRLFGQSLEYECEDDMGYGSTHGDSQDDESCCYGRLLVDKELRLEAGDSFICEGRAVLVLSGAITIAGEVGVVGGGTAGSMADCGYEG